MVSLLEFRVLSFSLCRCGLINNSKLLGAIAEESREGLVVGREVGRVNVQTSLAAIMEAPVNISRHEHNHKGAQAQ